MAAEDDGEGPQVPGQVGGGVAEQGQRRRRTGQQREQHVVLEGLAAFYRHFHSIDDLGLVIVDEAFATLRGLMRDARDDVEGADDMIKRSVAVLVRHVHDNRGHYRFIAREQFSAVVAVRVAIRREVRLFATELATDLARLPVTDRWPTEDLVMLAELIVGLLVDTARRLLEVIDETPERELDVIRETERRLRYLTIAAPVWKPRR